MATQLALQRNFVTITPSNQISSTNTQSSHSTTTIATPTTNGEILTISDSSQVSTSETSNAPIHIMQTHTQVNYYKHNFNFKLIYIFAHLFKTTEKIHFTSWNHFRWCLDHWCGANWPDGFTGWSTNYCLYHFAHQFSCIIAK